MLISELDEIEAATSDVSIEDNFWPKQGLHFDSTENILEGIFTYFPHILVGISDPHLFTNKI